MDDHGSHSMVSKVRMEWGGMGDIVAGLPEGWVGTWCHIQCSLRSHVVLETSQTLLLVYGNFTLWDTSVEIISSREICVEQRCRKYQCPLGA